MTAPVLRRVISAQVHGVVAVPMSLEYRTADPLAVTITLGSCAHRLIARSVLTAGLAPVQVADCADEWAASVFVLRLPGTDRVLIGLRSRPHRWVVTVSAAALEEFLAATYLACPAEREAQLVAVELETQCGFFYLSNGRE